MKEAQRYEVGFTFSIAKKGCMYAPIHQFSVSFDAVPEGEDPIAYLTSRFRSELRRVTKEFDFYPEELE